MLGVVAAMFIISNYAVNRYSFTLLLLCAYVSTFSLSSGVLLWIVVLLLMTIEAIKFRNVHIGAYIILWIVIFSATIFLYSFGYEQAALHNGLFTFLHHPVSFFSYIVVYIGASLKISGLGIKIPLTLFWGSLGIFLYGLCTWKAITKYPYEKLKPFLFFIGIGAFCILSAVVTAMGRSELGPGHATVSRYTTVTIMFWLSVLFMLFVVFNWKSALHWPLKKKDRRIGYALVGVAFLTLLFNSVASFKYFEKAFRKRTCGQLSVLTEKDRACLCNLYPDMMRLVVRDIPILEKHQLSVFHEGKIEE
jgi:hypothetical protein